MTLCDNTPPHGIGNDVFVSVNDGSVCFFFVFIIVLAVPIFTRSLATLNLLIEFVDVFSRITDL